MININTEIDIIELIGALRLLKCLGHAIDVGGILTEVPTEFIVTPRFSTIIRIKQKVISIIITTTKHSRFA